jgi:Protein of unknown function (DUF2804)
VTDALPWRAAGGATSGRPVDLARMPLVRRGRPRKRWCYVAAFGERVMLCAGEVEVGPARQSFWAVWDRERRVLREHTRLWRPRHGVRVRPGAVELRDGPVAMALRVDGGTPVETASAHGAGWIWTRKRGGARVRGRVVVDGEEIALDAPGCVDESAGYHARATAWEWSAGAGTTRDGRAVAWNLVAGVHDAPAASERTIWVEGEPAEAPPVRFAGALDAVTFAGGERLTFAAEAVRARDDALVVASSAYVQPFGAFGGTLPGGLELAEARGVMERHAARW